MRDRFCHTMPVEEHTVPAGTGIITADLDTPHVPIVFLSGPHTTAPGVSQGWEAPGDAFPDAEPPGEAVAGAGGVAGGDDGDAATGAGGAAGGDDGAGAGDGEFPFKGAVPWELPGAALESTPVAPWLAAWES